MAKSPGTCFGKRLLAAEVPAAVLEEPGGGTRGGRRGSVPAAERVLEGVGGHPHAASSGGARGTRKNCLDFRVVRVKRELRINDFRVNMFTHKEICV